ncbi:hypothetical protein HK098_005580 [Nowakowskiella sp. JEL0407]|nr:hypothetical protein HK098_005580 [Nowakowskiella sp. JEL0407]
MEIEDSMTQEIRRYRAQFKRPKLSTKLDKSQKPKRTNSVQFSPNTDIASNSSPSNSYDINRLPLYFTVAGLSFFLGYLLRAPPTVAPVEETPSSQPSPLRTFSTILAIIGIIVAAAEGIPKIVVTLNPVSSWSQAASASTGDQDSFLN